MTFVFRLLLLSSALVACPGSRAFGDAYPRQPGVDVVRYVFRIEVSDTTNEVVGETTVEVRFTEAGVTRFWLDLASGMGVRAVNCDGVPVAFAHASDRLWISLARPTVRDDRWSFVVQYRGVPASGLRAYSNRYGARLIRAENWPDQAKQWLPVIDHPSDKAASEFFVTAPARHRVVANGVLKGATDLGNGRRTTQWVQTAPIASWQNVIAVGPFQEMPAEPVNGIPVVAWTYPQDRPRAAPFLDATRRSLGFFAERVGPFPYGKLGAVETVSSFDGMENASAIFYTERSFDGSDPAALVAHEVAHQWFGSSVTESDWDDVWLSEGMATYGSLLFIEHARGRAAFLNGLVRSESTIFAAEAADPSATVVHANSADLRNVISPTVYEKGAWILHMLRGIVGDDAFWAGLRAYYQAHRDGNASSDDLRHAMEHASGRDLAWFFDQWLQRPGNPVLSLRWSYDAAGHRVLVDLAQSQPGALYRLPIDVGLTDARTRTLRVTKLESTKRREQFPIASDARPASVILDPYFWTLYRLSAAVR